jgi:hypothetical protein
MAEVPQFIAIVGNENCISKAQILEPISKRRQWLFHETNLQPT